MNTPELSPENVSVLIEQVLKARDPAAVGLRRILHKKEEEYKDYPFKEAVFEELETPGQKPKILNEEQCYILELEKKVADLQIALKKQYEKASTAIQAAYAKGRAEGFEQGRAEAEASTSAAYEKKIDALQERLFGMLEKLEQSKRAVLDNVDHLLLRLCCAMVKKITDFEVSVNQEIVLAVLKRALSYIGNREKMIIRVSPQDLETVSQRKDFWLPASQRLKDVIIEPDERIEKGGCIVESNSGTVDARLGVQFEEMESLIEKLWNEISSAPHGIREGLHTVSPHPAPAADTSTETK